MGRGVELNEPLVVGVGDALDLGIREVRRDQPGRLGETVERPREIADRAVHGSRRPEHDRHAREVDEAQHQTEHVEQVPALQGARNVILANGRSWATGPHHLFVNHSSVEAYLALRDALMAPASFARPGAGALDPSPFHGGHAR